MKKVYIAIREPHAEHYAISDYDDYLLEAHKAAEKLEEISGYKKSSMMWAVFETGYTSSTVFKMNKDTSIEPRLVTDDYHAYAVVGFDPIVANSLDKRWFPFEDAAYEDMKNSIEGASKLEESEDLF